MKKQVIGAVVIFIVTVGAIIAAKYVMETVDKKIAKSNEVKPETVDV